MNTLIAGALWTLLLICGRFQVMEGAPTRMEENSQQSTKLRNEFSSSLKLARQLLRDNKELIGSYTKKCLEQIWISPTCLRIFPLSASKSKSGLKMLVVERLLQLNEALQVYPVYLEELEKLESDEGSIEDGSSNVSGRITSVSLDLRDLLRHIRLQLSMLGVTPPTSLPPHRPRSSRSNWCSRVQIYKALSHMEKTLHRAVRDYTFLLRK